MNNSESSLDVVIQEASFSELNHLIDLYQRTENIVDCLPLMQPSTLRQIVINAADELSGTTLGIIDNIYEDFIEENPNISVSNFRPTLRMEEQIKDMIFGNTQFLEREINHYESRYESVVNQMQSIDSEVENNSYYAGMAGGVIGAALLGPLGAVAGGMAAGWFVGDSAGNNLQEEIGKLCEHFGDVIEKVNSHLEDMANRSIDLMVQYNNQLQGKVSA